MIRALVSTSLIFLVASDVLGIVGAMRVGVAVHLLGLAGLVTAGVLDHRQRATE